MVNHAELFTRREIVIDERNGYVVRELSAAQAEQIAYAFQAQNSDELEIKALLCALSLYDRDGNAIFNANDHEDLTRIRDEMPATLLQRIADAAMELFEAPANP